MLRIISGKFKGKKLLLPPENITKPTMDRVKESTFNILQNDIENKIVLDAFGGSGSIGIEFLSRGAKKVFFIEENKITFKVLKQNIESVNQINKEDYFLSKQNVLTFLKHNNICFDLVYLDPPFKKTYLILEIINILLTKNCLNKDAIIIIESSSKETIDFPSCFKKREVKHGSVNMIFLFF